MNLAGAILIYAGLLASFFGAVSLIRPLRFFGIANRWHGIAVFLCGIAVVFIAVCLPADEKRIKERRTELDDFVPVYQFAEFHSIRIRAPRERVYQVIHEVTPREIALFQTLTWIRRGGKPGPESILNAPPNEPILAVALRTSFMKLAEEPNREIVLGTLVAAPPGWRPKEKPTPEGFRAFREPGFALAAMNFRLEDAGNGETELTTETRVFATDVSTQRKFAGYWRVIYPGSALIRIMWLRAIKQRAEKPPA